MLQTKISQSELSAGTLFLLILWNKRFLYALIQALVLESPQVITCRNTHIKECSIIKLEAFVGFLYLAGLNLSRRHNLSDLWYTDGTAVEIFRIVMSKQRFHFVKICLSFDDTSTRALRKPLDKLAPIREHFEAFVKICKTYYIPDDSLTFEKMVIEADVISAILTMKAIIKYGIKIIA